MSVKRALLRSILLALPMVISRAARKDRSVRTLLGARDAVLQIRLRDGSTARHYVFQAGRVRGVAGAHPAPDGEMVFKNVDVALGMLNPKPNYAVLIDAAKNFKVCAIGDPAVVWFGQLMNAVGHAGWSYGIALPDGARRYTNLTNGGPIHVDVKDGRVVRTQPIALQPEDAASWEITARGRRFRPQRKSLVSPHALALKSMVYSDKRLLYPMKRVDFDPNGERNTHNRGKSGYVRISWDEALDLVSGELRRMKTQHGLGSVAVFHPAHHQWGNINYWLSALFRFSNLIGATKMGFSPVSWEGWYWGAMHHYGNNLRLGTPGFYGTLEDCLQHAEMIVFWSSDPESTNGLYAGFEATQRRLWAKELGIEIGRAHV
jgi:trimethylamine-N-oxide reductase (cytochrome c)